MSEPGLGMADWQCAVCIDFHRGPFRRVLNRDALTDGSSLKGDREGSDGKGTVPASA